MKAFKMLFSSPKKNSSCFQFDQAYRNSSKPYILQADIIHFLICITPKHALSFRLTFISIYNNVNQASFFLDNIDILMILIIDLVQNIFIKLMMKII